MTSLSDLDRPTKKKRAAQIAKKATPPTAMPTMAPVDRVWPPSLPPLFGVEVPVEVGALDSVDVASAGIG